MSGSRVALTGHRWEMRAPGELVRVHDVPFEPGLGEACVRVVGCGVCHTDLGYLYDGVRPKHELPLALGHEVSGEVVAVGEGAEEWLGRAVIVPAVTPCGECASCRAGRGQICPRQVMPGNDIQGGFASHLIVPARGLCHVDVPGALAGKLLAKSHCTLAELSVVADALTTPYQAVLRSGLEANDFAIVIGLGGVGGFAAQIAKAFGATVVGIDVNAQKLEALKPFGLDLAIDASQQDAKGIKAQLRDFAKQHGIPAVGWRIFECSGSAPGQELAWNLLCHGAFLSVVGFTLDRVSVRLSNLMAFDATAQGNWGCLPENYPGALQLVLDGKVALKPFVETHPLEDIRRVMEDVHAHRLNKRAVLVPNA